MRMLFEWLSSATLTVWFLTAFVLYYLTMAIWSEEAFAHFIEALSSSWPVRVLYIMFALNVTLRITTTLGRTFKKRKVKFFLMGPFMVGIVLFLFSSFLSVNLRQTKWLLVGQDQTVVLPWEEGIFRVLKIEPAIKQNTLRIGSSTRVFDYEPFLLLAGPDGQVRRIGAFPAKKVSKTYFHVLNFGLAPEVELYRQGRLLQKGYLALKVLPFGAVDRFTMQGLPYEFFIHIVPNKVTKKGDTSARYYDITRPVYNLEVFKADRRVLNTQVRDEVSFDGYTLRFLSPTYWELLEAVRDPVYPVFVLSLVLCIIGIVPWVLGVFMKS